MLGAGVPEASPVAPVAPVGHNGKSTRRSLRDAVARHIMQVLEEVGGNKRRAARELGVSRATLDRKLREISKPASK